MYALRGVESIETGAEFVVRAKEIALAEKVDVLLCEYLHEGLE